MADVKILIAGVDLEGIDKGDVVEVVSSECDWGRMTVTPKWIRLTVLNVPGNQTNAENRVRDLLGRLSDGFTYSKIDGAPPGLERYRIDLIPELVADIDLSTKQAIRNALLTTFNGTPVEQSKTHFVFDASPGLGVGDAHTAIADISFRRFCFPEAMVDQGLSSVSPGEPLEFTREFSWVSANIIDKLKV